MKLLLKVCYLALWMYVLLCVSHKINVDVCILLSDGSFSTIIHAVARNMATMSIGRESVHFLFEHQQQHQYSMLSKFFCVYTLCRNGEHKTSEERKAQRMKKTFAHTENPKNKFKFD